MTNEPNNRKFSRSAALLGVAVVSLAIAVAVVVLKVRHYKSTLVPAVATIATGAHEALRAFIKLEACEPTSCHEVECEPFSDGQTQNSHAHIVRCRWVDFRDKANPKRCAYAHYLVAGSGNDFGEFFLSARAPDGSCQPDKAFNDTMKGLGYSGPLP